MSTDIEHINDLSISVTCNFTSLYFQELRPLHFRSSGLHIYLNLTKNISLDQFVFLYKLQFVFNLESVNKRSFQTPRL